MPVKPTILVIEDDSAIRRGVTDALSFSGYEVLWAADAASGLRKAMEATYQLLLLDLVLPNGSGFDILEALRKQRPGQAVIVLSAKGEENDRVRGLRLGADDYVVKPFSVRELLARVEAVLRRAPERDAVNGQWSFEGGSVDFGKRQVRRDDGACEELSEREVELLRYLASNGGRAVARDELLRNVWRLDPRSIETRTIDMHIANLRAKLGDTGTAPRLLLTVRGKGYMLAGKPKSEIRNPNDE
jgi:DNA-binding response OmpR family regulator